VLPRRYTTRADGPSAFTDSERHLILAAETLRAGDTPPKAVPAGEKTEEKISLFWRVFGGTILSITALTVISAYQSLAKGIDELRGDVGRLREAGGDYIKKDEFNNRTTMIWNSIRETQAIDPKVTVLQNRATTLEAQLAAAEHERKDLVRELLTLRERLAKLEGAQEAKPVKPAAHAEPTKQP
jgi:hypothetical protein